VKISNILGKDFYPDLEKSEVQIYDGLDYRHWDTWNEGKFNQPLQRNMKAVGTDIMGKKSLTVHKALAEMKITYGLTVKKFFM
jgi:hypothetical protein